MEALDERMSLAAGRILEIEEDPGIPEPYAGFFRRAARLLRQAGEYSDSAGRGQSGRPKSVKNRPIPPELYEDIRPGRYRQSFACPERASEVLGETYGRLLCFLYAKIIGCLSFYFEGSDEALLVHMELFIQIYNCFEGEKPDPRELKRIVYWFESDYCDLFVPLRIRRLLRTAPFEAADMPEADPRFEADHTEDLALVLDSRFADRWLGVARQTLRTVREETGACPLAGHTETEIARAMGIACPEARQASCQNANAFNDIQRKLLARMTEGLMETWSELMKGSGT